jgi:hypothetical protein
MSEKTEHRFDATCKILRGQIKDIGKDVRTELRGLATHLEPQEVYDLAEVHANIMLAYRHLEDAAMRLGKAIQARDGGVSVYDK